MIALLAAVPEEARLIRETLVDFTESINAGLPLITGTLHEQPVCLTYSGIGKAAAAAAAVSLLLYSKPKALILFGCGGAYPNSGLQIGDLAIADEEIFGDEGTETPAGFEDFATLGFAMRDDREPRFNRWPIDTSLHDWAKGTLPELRSGPFVTVSTCTGIMKKAVAIEKRTAGICENMEGAAVALACHQLAVPMLELRGISNIVEDRDTSRWDLPAGMLAAQEAVIQLVMKWPESKNA